ncbi:hypothetical protein MKZ38_000377 [Zalerion maritima]|uniref:Mid2 domain-containing protein n=1 Tax=Zalerion maritima TaxID=339359 RepID=A0AAD5WU14_9PEZI|nr:hypothetical protein MKZ38_000377 [Zalerion maritima]
MATRGETTDSKSSRIQGEVSESAAVPSTTSPISAITAQTTTTANPYAFVAFSDSAARIYAPSLTISPSSPTATIYAGFSIQDLISIELLARVDGGEDRPMAQQHEISDARKRNEDSLARRAEDADFFTLNINDADPVGAFKILLSMELLANKDPMVYYFRTSMLNPQSGIDATNSQPFGVTSDISDRLRGFDATTINSLVSNDPEPNDPGSDSADSSATDTASEGTQVTNGQSGATSSSGTGLDNPGDSEDGKNGGGGLPVGAIVGIAIGAFVAVVFILGLIWLFMRRRKRTNMASHPDASIPLASGYGNGATGRSGDFIGEKEASGMAVAESPRSQMYTDQPPNAFNRRSSQDAGLGIGGTGNGLSENGHQLYDAGGSPTSGAAAPGPTPPPPVAREDSSRTGMNSPVPSATVARHLMDPDMTDDDVRRLEEEERELDRQIQEAGSRRK